METETEICNKTRAAIVSKLQELGAFVDEELPYYILLMVANKKTSQEMAEDLSLFLGKNTVEFTVWLDGVLEGLRIVSVEPESLRPKSFDAVTSESHASGSEMMEGEERKEEEEEEEALSVSNTSSVTPETFLSSSIPERHAESTDTYKSVEGSLQDRRGRSSRSGSGSSRRQEEEVSKRKIPMIHLVRVNKAVVEAQESYNPRQEASMEDETHHIRRVSSRLSIPRKPDFKPSLPPVKQASGNLELKTTSKAQDSISKSTAFQKVPKEGQRRNRSMKSKELSVDLRDRIVSMHKSGEGYKKIANALKVPSSTVSSIVVNWKKFGTTKTPPRAGRPAKLDKQTNRDKEVFKNPTVTLTKIQNCSVQIGEPDSHAEPPEQPNLT